MVPPSVYCCCRPGICADLAPKYQGLLVRAIPTHLGLSLSVWRGIRGTHGVEDHSEEELPSLDALVQLFWTPRVFFVENCVSEKPTGLSWENLKEE